MGNEMNGTISKPTDLAFRRLYYLTSEGALDEECHLWEAWIKFIQQSTDADNIIFATGALENCEPDDIWVDVAYGFKKRRLNIAAKVLRALGALVFPGTGEQYQVLKSVFRKAIGLEQEIGNIAGRLSQFREVRGQDSNPTIWEILSDTFAHDLCAPRSTAAHELDWGYSNDENDISDFDNIEDSKCDESKELDIDSIVSPLKNKVIQYTGPPVLLTCPQPGCLQTLSGQGNLRRHFVSHTQGDSHFKCLFCPYQSMHYRTLKRHVSNIHGLNKDGPMLLEMVVSGSRRLETLLRKAQGLTGDDFEVKIWL